MILSKQDAVDLNHFQTPAGEVAIKLLGEKLYQQYAKEAIISDGIHTEYAKGAARLAILLKDLPEILANVRTASV